MINYHKSLVNALKTILPTYYEMVLTSNIKTPCISYIESNNHDDKTGNTIGYSKITYTIKVWGNNIEILQEKALEIDKVLRPLGFKRISTGELYDKNSSMIQKIMNYECLAIEKFN